MSVYLLDTNILSALRKPKLNPEVVAWVTSLSSSQLRVSVISFGEIRRGIELKALSDSTQSMVLDGWHRQMLPFYGNKILGIDLAVAEAWGSLGLQRPLGLADGLIAATALVHGLTLATRNTKDFEPHGIDVINPFAI